MASFGANVVPIQGAWNPDRPRIAARSATPILATLEAPHFDLDQWSGLFRADNVRMKLPTDDRSGENLSTSKPPHVAEARRMIEEYANDLREIIKKLRRMMN